jgi:hypothetical protein
MSVTSVTVDDRELAAESLGLKTVGQVLSHLNKKGDTRGRLIVHVRIDGEEPDLKRIKAIKKFPLAGHTVLIETADPRDMARQFLDEVDAQLTEADRLKSESARLLGNNQYAPAMEKLGGCFKTWQHAQDSLMKTAQLLRIDPARVKVHGRAVTELLSDFATQLRQMRTALEGRDFNALADLLAHKMSRAFEQWRDAVRSFRGVILV